MDPNIEEEVTIEIQGIEFTGFSFTCPYKIKIGHIYPVLLGFIILDKITIQEGFAEDIGLERVGSGYKYCIRGILHENWIDAGIIIVDDDEYFVDYPNLFGKYVELWVDRISIEFLKM